MNELFLGIDGGIKGGLCLINRDHSLVAYSKMPIVKIGGKNEYDVSAIINFLKTAKIKSAVLEKAHVMPRNGIKAAFGNGQNFGTMKAILSFLEIPFEIVSAKHWQKEIFQGITVKDTKTASKGYVSRKFPYIDEKAKKNDGITDSICIALYCCRNN